MSILHLLASVQGLRGSEANIRLAKDIAASNNKAAVKELVENLNNKNKNIQSDCIKTLYETAYIKPELIADESAVFISLLQSKNNRLVWGAMYAISCIADLKHKEVYAALDSIMKTVAKGSVITIDNGVEILSRLNKYPQYTNTTDHLLIEQLWQCPIKQLPMYIEKAIISINKVNKEIYINLTEKRKTECERDTQLKRLEKSIKQMMKI
ncbi:MAG: hypothetical protein NTZ33_01170 [Bacteroidetes bacterium]|nr:hypothetical protein [Bacteroidota bacterium]